MASQSFRVPVAALIEAAEKERERIIDTYSVALAEYRASQRTPRAERLLLAAALHERAEEVRTGKGALHASSEYDYDAGEYVLFVSAEAKVQRFAKPDAADTRSVDRDLRLLRATSQETVSVRADSDFARYV